MIKTNLQKTATALSLTIEVDLAAITKANDGLLARHINNSVKGFMQELVILMYGGDDALKMLLMPFPPSEDGGGVIQ